MATVDRENHIRAITLNRPPRDMFDSATCQELVNAITVSLAAYLTHTLAEVSRSFAKLPAILISSVGLNNAADMPGS
jgi:hypothetical protein